MKKVRKLIRTWREDVFVIRYEDLVDNGYTVVRDLCEFLGLEFSESMLFPEETNTSFKEIKKRKGIYKDSKEKWREVLANEDIKTVERICSDIMLEFGYIPDNRRVYHYLTISEMKFKLFIETNITLGKLGFRPFRAYLNNVFRGKIRL